MMSQSPAETRPSLAKSGGAGAFYRSSVSMPFVLSLVFIAVALIIYPVFAQAKIHSGPGKEWLRAKGVGDAVLTYALSHGNRLPDFSQPRVLDLELQPLIAPPVRGRKVYEDATPPSGYFWNQSLSRANLQALTTGEPHWMFFTANSYGRYTVGFTDGRCNSKTRDGMARVLASDRAFQN